MRASKTLQSPIDGMTKDLNISEDGLTGHSVNVVYSPNIGMYNRTGTEYVMDAGALGINLGTASIVTLPKSDGGTYTYLAAPASNKLIGLENKFFPQHGLPWIGDDEIGSFMYDGKMIIADAANTRIIKDDIVNTPIPAKTKQIVRYKLPAHVGETFTRIDRVSREYINRDSYEFDAHFKNSVSQGPWEVQNLPPVFWPNDQHIIDAGMQPFEPAWVFNLHATVDVTLNTGHKLFMNLDFNAGNNYGMFFLQRALGLKPVFEQHGTSPRTPDYSIDGGSTLTVVYNDPYYAGYVKKLEPSVELIIYRTNSGSYWPHVGFYRIRREITSNQNFWGLEVIEAGHIFNTLAELQQLTESVPGEIMYVRETDGTITTYANTNATFSGNGHTNAPTWSEQALPGFADTRIRGFRILQTDWLNRPTNHERSDLFKKPTVGTPETNPHPLFTQGYILGVGEFAGRSFIVSTRGIDFSEAGEKTNYYRTDLGQILDTDPFRVSVDIPREKFGTAFLIYEDSIVLNSKPVQRISYNGSSFNISTVRVSNMGIVPYSNITLSKDKLFYLETSPGGIRLKSVSTGIRSEQLKITDHSKHWQFDSLDRYNNPNPLIVYTGEAGEVFVANANEPTALYGYAWDNLDDNRRWSAWRSVQYATMGGIYPSSFKNPDYVFTQNGIVARHTSIVSDTNRLRQLLCFDASQRITVYNGTTVANATTGLSPRAFNVETGVMHVDLAEELVAGTYVVGYEFSVWAHIRTSGFLDRYKRRSVTEASHIHRITIIADSMLGAAIRHNQQYHPSIAYEFRRQRNAEDLATAWFEAIEVGTVYEHARLETDIHARADEFFLYLTQVYGLGLQVSHIEIEGQFAVRSARTQ